MSPESRTPSPNSFQPPARRPIGELMVRAGTSPEMLAANGIVLEDTDLRQNKAAIDPRYAVDLDGNGLIAVINVAETRSTPGTLVKVYGIKSEQGQFSPDVVVLGGINYMPHYDSKNSTTDAFGFVPLSKRQGLTQFGRELPGADRLGLANNPRASRVHFLVTPTESGFTVDDASSTNGTTVITGHREAETEQRVRKLAAYIEGGIELIRQGKLEDAQTHFKDVDQARDLGVILGDGRCTFVEHLMTDEDVIRVAREVGASSEHIYGTVSTGGYCPITFTTFEEHPERYNPELVFRFKYEVALTHAEERLHDLQDKNGGLLTGNVTDSEADVAAYLYQHGLALSTDFLTRYKSRMVWYLTFHPERADELRRFREKWGGF